MGTDWYGDGFVWAQVGMVIGVYGIGWYGNRFVWAQIGMVMDLCGYENSQTDGRIHKAIKQGIDQ